MLITFALAVILKVHVANSNFAFASVYSHDVEGTGQRFL